MKAALKHMLVMAGLLVASTSAFAETFKAKIDFPFRAGSTVYPAAEYDIQVYTLGGSPIVKITDPTTNSPRLMMPMPTDTNGKSGESKLVFNCISGAKVWGDPHVDEKGDGRTDWDFKKNMTFKLDDGTKITVRTTPAGGGTTVSSELIVTNGPRGMRVTGLAAGDKDGKLTVTGAGDGKRLNGYRLDRAFADGPVVREFGSGWRALNGRVVDHKYAEKNL